MKKILLMSLAALFVASNGEAAPVTKLKWHGHAAFEITTPKGQVLLIDPWLSNPLNPAAKDGKDPLAVLPKVDYILITHGHFDHVGDAVAIARATKARLVANFELGTNMARVLGYPAEQMGFDTLMNVGGEIKIADGEVTVIMVPAVHSSSLDPQMAAAHTHGDKAAPPAPLVFAGNPNGFLLKIKGGPSIYHTGDTAYFRDMQLLAAHRPDVALINIGGHFGMEPAQAAMAAWVARARLVVPHHYKTFPILTQDEAPFLKALQRRLIASKVMQPGQTLTFAGKNLKE